MNICEYCNKEFKNLLGIVTHMMKCSSVIDKPTAKCKFYEKYYKIDKSFLLSEYIDKKNGLRTIFKNTKIPYVVLLFLLKYYEIKMRSLKESIQIQNERNKLYFIDKYGVENPFQIQSSIEKIQLKRSKHIPEIYENIKKNNKIKYGVENPFQVEEFKEKSKKTNLEKYGVEHYTQTQEFKDMMREMWTDEKIEARTEKYKKTILEKYGVENIFELKEYIQEKIFEKYGVKNVSHIPEIIEKRKLTFMKLYGVENPFFLAKFRGAQRRTSCHTKITDFLKSKNIIFIEEKRISGFNVDIFIEPNIVIEVQGDFWHANPINYLMDDIVPIPGTNKTVFAFELWFKDLFKVQKIINDGNLVFVYWESDINKNFDKIKEELCKLLKLSP